MQRMPAVAVALLSVASPVHAADPSWVERSNDNARLLLEVTGKYRPEVMRSFEAYDENVADLSQDWFAAHNADNDRVIGEYRKRLTSETDAKVKQDLEILDRGRRRRAVQS